MVCNLSRFEMSLILPVGENRFALIGELMAEFATLLFRGLTPQVIMSMLNSLKDSSCQMLDPQQEEFRHLDDHPVLRTLGSVMCLLHCNVRLRHEHHFS